MKKSIRKTAVSVSVVYSDGAFSNDLTGHEIQLDNQSGCLCLRVDLTPNIRVRNKQANCYYDACELELALGEKGTFKYAVKPRGSCGSIIFDELTLVAGCEARK